MTINFPQGIDSWVNPSASDSMNSVPHDLQHANANDAIVALERAVGANNSADAASLQYKMTNHTHASSSILGLDSAISNNATVVANTSAQHTHANKTALDTLSLAQSALLSRANHTGSQTSATISDFADSVYAKIEGSSSIVKTQNATTKGAILSVANDSSTQRVGVSVNGSALCERKMLNFVAGSGISCSVSDNSAANRADITITSSVIGSGLAWGAAINGSTGNGLTLSLDPSTSASTNALALNATGDNNGVLLSLAHSYSGALSARTADYAKIAIARTSSGTNTTDTFNAFRISRSFTQSISGQTSSQNGSVLLLENTSSIIYGSVADNVNILQINQNNNISNGKVLSANVNGVEKISMQPAVADNSSAVAYKFDTVNTLSWTGAKLFSLCSGGSEKMSVDLLGFLKATRFTTDGSNSWQLGKFYGGAPAAAGYVQVTINGQAYKLLATS